MTDNAHRLHWAYGEGWTRKGGWTSQGTWELGEGKTLRRFQSE